jgi:four helix bundle protein
MPNKYNIIQEKSYKFAIRIVNLYRYLCENKNEYVLSKQILRSGTSIWANIEEAIGWHSKKDFNAKISVSYKEARETDYWLRLLKDTGYITEKEFIDIRNDCEELLRILGTIKKRVFDTDNIPLS